MLHFVHAQSKEVLLSISNLFHGTQQRTCFMMASEEEKQPGALICSTISELYINYNNKPHFVI